MPSPKPSNTPLLQALPPKTYPLIELLGELDSGKVQIGQALARKLKGQCLQFPMFNAPRSLTGLGLMTLLGQNTELLESNPQWWCLMYAANLWENADKVRQALRYGPVVVINWTTAAKVYHRILTDADKRASYELIRGLPEPDFRFIILGERQDWPGNFDVSFTPLLTRRLNAGMRNFSRAPHLRVEHAQNPLTAANKCAQEIADSILKKRPDLKNKSVVSADV